MMQLEGVMEMSFQRTDQPQHQHPQKKKGKKKKLQQKHTTHSQKCDTISASVLWTCFHHLSSSQSQQKAFDFQQIDFQVSPWKVLQFGSLL